jgi:pimeloyl-ACP methyl ester carboxylesterase
MYSRILLVPLFASFSGAIFAQFNPSAQDSTLNNLVFPANYKTCKLGSLGAVKKIGRGVKSMILISGLGFRADVLADFINKHKDSYTIYAVTPAGFGGTPAPPIPGNGTPYSKLTWTNGIVKGVLDLIEKEKLDKPIIVGHFVTATQVALSLALKYPDKISKVVILGGEPYRYYRPYKDTVWGNEQKYSVEQRENMIEFYWRKWFKTVTKKTWDDGMYRPLEYSTDSIMGERLFAQSAAVPIQVMIRYLLEFFTFDISSQYKDIKVPVLILMPSFNKDILSRKYHTASFSYTGEYLYYYYQQAWNSAKESNNPLFQFQVIPDSRIFVWYDNPKATYTAINNFLIQ